MRSETSAAAEPMFVSYSRTQLFPTQVVKVGARDLDPGERNTIFLARPSGEVRVYRKVHLDYKEREVFVAGSDFLVEGELGIG